MSRPPDSNRPAPPPAGASPGLPDAATAGPEGGGEGVEVVALLICREVQQGRSGVTLKEIVEIVPVVAFPGEAGPLTFCAILRSHRAGEAEVGFRVHPLHHPETTLIEMPGRLRVERGLEGRQTVVSAGFRSMKIHAGGWFGVEFRVGGRVAARTRFAVGALTSAAAPGPGSTGAPSAAAE